VTDADLQAGQLPAPTEAAVAELLADSSSVTSMATSQYKNWKLFGGYGSGSRWLRWRSSNYSIDTNHSLPASHSLDRVGSTELVPAVHSIQLTNGPRRMRSHPLLGSSRPVRVSPGDDVADMEADLLRRLHQQSAVLLRRYRLLSVVGSDWTRLNISSQLQGDVVQNVIASANNVNYQKYSALFAELQGSERLADCSFRVRCHLFNVLLSPLFEVCLQSLTSSCTHLAETAMASIERPNKQSGSIENQLDAVEAGATELFVRQYNELAGGELISRAVVV
jgi:hypothetical protein